MSDKHYNLTTSEDNGKSLVTTNVSTKHPDEIVRLMTLAGLAAVKLDQADCGCDAEEEEVVVVDEANPDAEYVGSGPQELDLDDFSKKTADSISRQKKRIQPSMGDNPLQYSQDEDDIYESLMVEFDSFLAEEVELDEVSNSVKDQLANIDLSIRDWEGRWKNKSADNPNDMKAPQKIQDLKAQKDALMKKHGIKEEVEQLEELTASEKKLINQMYDKKGNLTPIGKKVMDAGQKKESVELGEQNSGPCWDDYEQIGTKKKNGKEVPNCVPKNKKK